MRSFLLAVCAAACVSGCAPAATQPVEDRSATLWHVESAPGLDALFLLAAATGDPLQAPQYPNEIDWIEAELAPEALAGFQGVADRMRDEMGSLPGPILALVFSGCAHESLQDVMTAAREPQCMEDSLRASPYYSDEFWGNIVSVLPEVGDALTGLEAAGYEAWYQDTVAPDIAEAVEAHRAVLLPRDVISHNEQYLSRSLDPDIHIVLLKFSGPYGARMLGQRFTTRYDFNPDIQLRTAVHELFHPPFDITDETVWAALQPLTEDPWLVSLIEHSNPIYGYSSLRGIVDEDSAQALEQIVNEQLDVALDPGEDWRRSDEGMHMLAAALYQAMREDGFAQEGGEYQAWLVSAVERGLFGPGEIRRRAGLIVGEEAVAKWDPE